MGIWMAEQTYLFQGLMNIQLEKGGPGKNKIKKPIRLEQMYKFVIIMIKWFLIYTIQKNLE